MLRSGWNRCSFVAILAAALAMPLAPAAESARAGEPPGAPANPDLKSDADAASAAAAAKLARDVDRAVERGVAWLRGQRRGDGSFGSAEGEAGLALLTLRHCGAARDDRDVVAAAKRVVADVPTGNVYGDSFAILGLLAQDPRHHAATIRKAIARLVQAQCENGQWTYIARGRGSSRIGDSSNMQCAVLALGMAREHGFEVPAEVFRRAGTFAQTARNEDGGYGYSEKQDSKSYGSMTAAMLTVHALAIAADRAKPVASLRLADEPALAPALRWLGERFDVEGNPRASGKATSSWMYCWFWSLERAGALLATDRIGGRDWYAEGAAALVARQRDSGSWIGDRELADTCWALLFLRRSTRQWVITPRDGRDPSAPAPSGPITGTPKPPDAPDAPTTPPSDSPGK